MPSATTLASAVLLAGVAAANPLTTLAVCPGADPIVPSCTVTAQHQSISTCSPVSTTCSTQSTSTWGAWETSHKNATATTSTSSFKSCSTAYSYSTWAWVSTVIPCGWNGKSISSCTVTSTQQNVPCEVSVTTSTSSTPTHTNYITSYVTYTVTPTGTSLPHTPSFSVSSSVSTVVDYSTSYQTISKMWNAPYNKLGPSAIPGYAGNDLYHDDSTVDGESAQYYDVVECEAWNGKAPSCSSYTENHYNTISGYHSSTSAVATNSMKTSVPSAGAYTFTFTNSAPSAVITSQGQAYTQPPQPWFNYETRTASGPTNFDFTVTVTKTISIYWPGHTSAGSPAPVAASAAQKGWGNWNAPSQPTSGSDPAGSSGWGNWNNGGQNSPNGGKPTSGNNDPSSSSGSSGWGNWNNGGQGASAGNQPSPTGAPWSGQGGFSGFPGAPGSGTFNIPVDTSSGSKYSTSSNQWVGFPSGSEDGTVVTGQENAANFYWDSDGNLMCNGQYVSTSTSAGYLVFELGPNKPSGPKFSVGPNGSFGLPGAGFCVVDNTLFITFGGSPNGCKPVSCPLNGGSSSTTSNSQSWGQWAAPTSSWTTQTTASSGSKPTSDQFAISVVLSGSKNRGSDSYIAFSGNNAIRSSTNFAYFTFGGGSVFLAGSSAKFGASSASGATQLQSFSSAGDALSSSWSISGGYLSYPGSGFCVSGGAVQIFFGSAPSGCLVASLGVDYNPSTSPTQTADPSGDYVAWEAMSTPTASARKRSGGLQF